MAYSDQKMSGGKIGALVIVALIHIALGYAFVTGLATNFVKKQVEKLNTFDVEEPPPPPPDEPPPPPPPDQPMTPPPVVTPPPIVRPPVVVPQAVVTVPTAPPVVYAPPAPPAPPSPAPPAPPPPKVVSQAAGLKGNPGQYFGADAYPAAAIRAEAQGRVVAQLTVDTSGRVSGCSVTTSSGNSDLDDATCRIAKRSVRFSPAKDQTGAAIASSYTLPVRWVLPKD
jgi:protein TonB